jgi:excisionase family DNA binding protein
MDMNMSTEQLLTPRALADECGVTVGRIHQLIQAGRIRATRLGEKNFIITRADADAFKAERQREAGIR